MSNPVNQTPGPRVYGQHVSALVAGAVRALFPARCLLCAEPGHRDQDLCLPCRRALPWLPPPSPAGPEPGVHACFVYAPPVSQLLQGFKFHGDLAAGRLLAELMHERLARAGRPQALVPMPLHRARLRQRGYDQALELARPVARALGLPLAARLLWRQRATQAQSELGAAARQRNVRGAFGARPGGPSHVALLDDVLTTGATVQAAALALRQAGAARVDVWVCARVP